MSARCRPVSLLLVGLFLWPIACTSYTQIASRTKLLVIGSLAVAFLATSLAICGGFGSCD